MLTERAQSVLSRIAVLTQEIYDREKELELLAGGIEKADAGTWKNHRKPSRMRRLSKEQRIGSREPLKALVRDMVASGGRVTQLAVMANSRSSGIVTNQKQVAQMLRYMAKRGEIDEAEGRNEAGEREYRKRIGL